MYSDPRIPGLYYCNLLSLLSLVLCCDIHRSTLISIMYPVCMITVHDRKSRALHPPSRCSSLQRVNWVTKHRCVRLVFLLPLLLVFSLLSVYLRCFPLLYFPSMSSPLVYLSRLHFLRISLSCILFKCFTSKFHRKI